MKARIKNFYDSLNARTLHASLVGFTVLLLAFLLPR